MITIEQYFGKWLNHKDVTDEVKANAELLRKRSDALEKHMIACGVEFLINPATKSNISGKDYGGFRPQECTIGAPKSAHKTGEAEDRYDPNGKIDKWLLTNEKLLDHFELWFEHPSATPNWSHWSTRKPRSGNRFFYP